MMDPKDRLPTNQSFSDAQERTRAPRKKKSLKIANKISTDKTVARTAQAENQSYRSGAVPKKSKDARKDQGRKRASSFRPLFGRQRYLDASNNIKIRSTTLGKNGGGGCLRNRMRISVWTIRQEPQRHGDDAHTLAGQIQFGSPAQGPKSTYFSPRLARIDWRLIAQWSISMENPPRLRHTSTYFPEPTQKPTAATVFSPRARAEMGPAMQVIL